jgi:hypothetical protein
MCGITRRPARLCALGNRTSLEGTPKRVGVIMSAEFGIKYTAPNSAFRIPRSAFRFITAESIKFIETEKRFPFRHW